MHVKDLGQLVTSCHSAVNRQVQKHGYYSCGGQFFLYDRLPNVLFTHEHDWVSQRFGQLLNCEKFYRFTYGIYYQICIRATKSRTMNIISPTIVAKDFTHKDYPPYGIS